MKSHKTCDAGTSFHLLNTVKKKIRKTLRKIKSGTQVPFLSSFFIGISEIRQCSTMRNKTYFSNISTNKKFSGKGIRNLPGRMQSFDKLTDFLK